MKEIIICLREPSYFGFAHLSDENMLIPSEKFQIDEILQDMPPVHVPIS